MDKEQILDAIRNYDFSPDPFALHEQLAGIIMQSVSEQWKNDAAFEGKQAYYLSFEYLPGKMIFGNLMNLGILGETNKILREKGIDIRALEDTEDIALGSGGLGRLAACFLESAAAKRLPLCGYGLRYKHGLFRQQINDGFQIEVPDDWQKHAGPDSVRRGDIKETVSFAFKDVTAVAYDMPVIGYNRSRIGLLRLWQAEGGGAQSICDVLYPDDSGDDGKKLRITQEYFLSSASLQNVLRRYVKTHGEDFGRFARYNIFQLNDTHPVLAVLEFIRLLTQRYGVGFNGALDIAKDSFAYTNHTVMSEALECWDIGLINELIPDIAEIARKIDRATKQKFADNPHRKDVSIITDGRINMARLALHACGCVNGVSEIHTNILKQDLFKAFDDLYPGKIQNKTNGITHRRWLKLANPQLADFIEERIGQSWITDPVQLERLRVYADDGQSLSGLNEIKQSNKVRLAEYLRKKKGFRLEADSIFDVQIKRLHEYKRQLMNVLSILYLYFGIKDGSVKGFFPVTYLFGAKAAGSYYRAKGIIKLINETAKLISADAEARRFINVVFIPNYNVSLAELIIPAADVSEQISLAGTEASGTGNMKLMMNGAVTLGTMDGANIEIVSRAGLENNYIFGMDKQQAQSRKQTYNSKDVLNGEPDLRRVVDTLTDGALDDNGTGHFRDIYNSIVEENDRYMVLADLKCYIEAKLNISRDYQQRSAFASKAMSNIAGSGFFSSDLTIERYAKEIWSIESV